MTRPQTRKPLVYPVLPTFAALAMSLASASALAQATPPPAETGSATPPPATTTTTTTTTDGSATPTATPMTATPPPPPPMVAMPTSTTPPPPSGPKVGGHIGVATSFVTLPSKGDTQTIGDRFDLAVPIGVSVKFDSVVIDFETIVV